MYRYIKYKLDHMKLREYIHSFPRGKRMKARKIIADALRVSESAVKSWETGIRNPKDKYLNEIEEITNGKVKKADYI